MFTGYTLSQLLPCLLRVARVHTAACNTQLPCAISCKYLDEQLEQVATLPPVEQHKVLQLEQEQLLLQKQQEQLLLQKQQQRYHCKMAAGDTAYSRDC
jgi:hypothetical protein